MEQEEQGRGKGEVEGGKEREGEGEGEGEEEDVQVGSVDSLLDDFNDFLRFTKFTLEQKKNFFFFFFSNRLSLDYVGWKASRVGIPAFFQEW